MATTKLNIADLVARMPATDKEIEMQKPLPPDGTKKTGGPSTPSLVASGWTIQGVAAR